MRVARQERARRPSPPNPAKQATVRLPGKPAVAPHGYKADSASYRLNPKATCRAYSPYRETSSCLHTGLQAKPAPTRDIREAIIDSADTCLGQILRGLSTSSRKSRPLVSRPNLRINSTARP